MGLIKVKMLPFRTGEQNNTPCLVSIYINAKIVWCGRCDCIAVFEAQDPSQVGFLFYDVRISDNLPYKNDLVITGILSPDKQYEMIQSGTEFRFIEIGTNQRKDQAEA